MSRLFVIPRRDDSQASVEPDRTRLLGARLLLVTGTGGSGKRIVGNMLVDERSFVHIDFDNSHANKRFLGHGVEGLRAELEANLEPGQDLVITWTPTRNGALPFVRLLQSYGFDWVWCDGDRGAAFHGYFSARNGDAARFVDPFELDGTFRPLAAVVDEVLTPGPVAQPLPERVQARTRLAALTRRERKRERGAPLGWLVPVGTRLRAGVAAGTAFGLAAAAASAYVLIGGFGGDGPLGLKSAQARPAMLPAQGLLVGGKSLAGVELGDTAADVRGTWGRNFTKCGYCDQPTWFFTYPPPADPVGAGVTFRNGRVTSVFTLGMKRGWRSDDGLKVGGLMSTKLMHEESEWKMCAGYSAKVETSKDAVTSILMQGPIVYGFALSKPSEPICH